ncbi:protein DpdD [Actinoplanes sp. DH11]|uniref:protein DpdD n=1 Tax=Actinoplanes sp. DH11 TaxID=2857011 RepID=UPI001E62A035|nr:protein DpdD [Actinoplanes sp. DH11]
MVNRDAFLDVFFGTGNESWPGRSPQNTKAVSFLDEFLDLSAGPGSAVPHVLPRTVRSQTAKYVYVIPQDVRQANTVREWLNAFVVPSYATFVARPEALRAGDPIDDAVAAFAGHRRVFVLEHPAEKGADLWRALRLMVQTIAQRPATEWHDVLPVGRLLAEFELAMAAGDHRSTAALLSRLEGSGLGGMNIAYLTVKRLARLGQHAELLRLPQLLDVIATRPPAPVREAILDALHSTLVAGPLTEAGPDAARLALAEQASLAPRLADGPLNGLGTEALTVLALAAAGTDDAALWQRLRADQIAWARLSEAKLVAEYVETFRPAFRPQPAETPKEIVTRAEPVENVTGTTPAGWVALVEAIAADRDIRLVMAEERWRDWEPAAASDQVLADLLNGLDNDGAERAWQIVGAFVEADGYRRPASRTARAFLANALSYSRFEFSDMAGIVALLEIALRGALSANEYSALLADLSAESARWVSVNHASIVLDMCDVIARASSPVEEARQRITEALLAPLAQKRARLETDQLALARIIDGELGLGLPWDVNREAGDTGSTPVTAREVLLYSLDEGALRRAGEALKQLAPSLNIQFSSDHVGGPRLKQWVRRADVIIMATRCATHAATGFIRAEARAATVIREADGAGSASLLRAASSAL